MNTEEVINWCKTSISQWPSSVNQLASPPGWNWRFKTAPYCMPEIVLQTVVDDKVITISKSDIK